MSECECVSVCGKRVSRMCVCTRVCASSGRPLPWAEALILTLLGLDLVGLCLLALVWLWLLHQPLGSASLGDKPLSSGVGLRVHELCRVALCCVVVC